jgi:hypothetical protein
MGPFVSQRRPEKLDEESKGRPDKTGNFHARDTGGPNCMKRGG